MKTDQEKLEVARTILQQLGGNKFVVMTGARDFVGLDNGLRFKLRRANKQINRVSIVLNSLDTYDVKFEKVRMKGLDFTLTTVAEHNGIYEDMLQDVFTAETGLNTHL